MQRHYWRDVVVLATGGGANLLAEKIAQCAVPAAFVAQLSVIPTLSFEGMLALIEVRCDG